MSFPAEGPCPRCGAPFLVWPALSRLDNKTYICSDCGTSEALFNWFRPGDDLPPTNEPVPV